MRLLQSLAPLLALTVAAACSEQTLTAAHGSETAKVCIEVAGFLKLSGIT